MSDKQSMSYLDGKRDGYKAVAEAIGLAWPSNEAAVLARCRHLAAIESVDSERQPTLEAFADEVRYTLGEGYRERVSAEGWLSPSGERCLRVVCRGTAQGHAVEWRHGLVMAADGGPCVSFATTLFGTAEAFGQADRELQDAVRFVGETPLGQADRRATTTR